MKVINKTFDILEFVINNLEEPVNPKMVSEKLNINHSTCIRIMSLLRNKGYLKQISRRGGYIPGAALFAHSNSMHWVYGRIAHAAEAPIIELAKDLNTVVNISVMQDGAKYILYHYCGSRNRRIAIRTRYENDHHCNATGMLLLSLAEKDIIKNYYETFSTDIRHMWQDIDSLESFNMKLSELNQKREISYISTQNPNMLIAGRLVDISDNVTAAIGFGCYETCRDDVIKKTRQTAMKIHEIYNEEEQLVF